MKQVSSSETLSPTLSSTAFWNSVPTVRGAVGFLSIAVYALVSLGGLVRNAGAGLSCPDWPLCFGKVVPPMDVQVFLEWFHRLIAGSISICLLFVTAAIFSNRELRQRLGKYCVVALVLLAAQVVLGGLTVIGLLSPKWVVSHLAVGLAFFGTLFVLWLELLSWDRKPARAHSPQLKKSAYLTTGVLYIQIILGGLVSSNYAGLACPDFPKCFGLWLPPFEGLVRFQLLHRAGAIITTGAVVTFLLLVWKNRKSEAVTEWVNTVFWLLPILVVLQVALGIASVLYLLPLPISVAHLATATLILANLLVMSYEFQRR